MTISHSHYILTFVDRWYWSINLVQLDARWSRGGTQFNQIITMGYVDDDGYYYCWASRTACNRNWWHQERNENTLKINYRFQVYKHTQHTMTLFFFFSSFSLKFFGDDGSVSTPQPYAFHSLTSTHRVLLLLLVFVCCVWVPSARFLCTHFLASISCALSAMPSYTFPCDRCRRRRVHCGRRRHRAKTRSNTMYT